ncbi:hypothetical protein FB45DRAFT_935136 [Roridomyces roridus]|uniref:Zn(2)-C6 fungal-type domain-containing protein n=1 Tax=Roridomyces roridus TaxID=1738132 RepID=A0AAD7BBM2_9AGAR|nr:hypothetical protein FB45DRAFT_935136 [Roridomyces roridus]
MPARQYSAVISAAYASGPPTSSEDPIASYDGYGRQQIGGNIPYQYDPHANTSEPPLFYSASLARHSFEATTTTMEAPEASTSSIVKGSGTRPRRRTSTTAVIACRQCRTRKIRCDSTRPGCANCQRRADQCEYDPAPKRRGPDKRPGTRQRRCKPRAGESEEPRAQSGVSGSDDAEEGGMKLELLNPLASPPRSIALPSPVHVPAATQMQIELEAADGNPAPAKRRRRDSNATTHPHSLRISTDDAVLSRRAQPPSASSRYEPTPTYAFDFVARPLSGYDLEQDTHPKFPPPPPAVHGAQQGWWDAFLRSYSLREIATDLNFLYSETASLSFVNVRLLLETLWSPTRYLTLQPAFILASMALAMLIRSSEAERGTSGRDRAAFLRHSAQDALERAWREGVWLDASLVEAALILVVYEASAHPEYHPSRLAQAFRVLDDALATLGLTSFDAGMRDVCRYASGAAPLADAPSPSGPCRCIPPGSPAPARDAVWPRALPWDPSWGAHEIRDEECRRVCWSALSLVTSFRTECLAFSRPDECEKLRMCDPSSYLLMFPNELYERGRRDAGGGTHAKNSVWALYGRSMLLANFAANVVERGGKSRDRDERESTGEALQEAWQETQAIQDELDAHVCNLHTATAYLARENVANAQMIVTKGLRSLHGLPAKNLPGPLFNRRQAEEWIYYQAEVIKRVTMSISYLSDPRAQQLTHRPFSVTWFYSQLAICLLLWENDPTLEDALQLAKSLLIPLDVMNALWPCQLIQAEYGKLRRRLAANCKSAGQDLPPAESYVLPPQPVGAP